jgi:hypothetical protein
MINAEVAPVLAPKKPIRHSLAAGNFSSHSAAPANILESNSMSNGLE